MAMVQMISGEDCLHENVERLQRAFDEEIKFKNLIWRCEVNNHQHPSNFNVGCEFGSNPLSVRSTQKIVVWVRSFWFNQLPHSS